MLTPLYRDPSEEALHVKVSAHPIIAEGRALGRGFMLVLGLALAGCSSGPDYQRPAFQAPAAYKEAGAWTPATPQAAGAGRSWWTVYGDADLDALVRQADAANQSLQVAQAQYRQARAEARLARAAFAPTVGANLNSGRSRALNSAGVLTTGSSSNLGLDASWEPDLWGQVRRSVEAGEATAQASAADLAAARLSIEAELVQDYLQLRITDADQQLLARTVEDERRVLALTRSQFRAGVAMRSDVALAESQLQTTAAQQIDLGVQRRQLEHAIAILTGQPPSALSIAARPEGELGLTLPAVPAALPSELLQRRPDIAGAERRAAAANAEIGVAQAAYFPSLSLNASAGLIHSGLTPWADAPGHVWSLGAALAATLFDGGARSARSDAAIAAYDATVAQYKQTVLGGLQEVEDNLAALDVLAQEQQVLQAAVDAAQVAERVSLAQYRAGTTTYLTVATAQNLALTNQRSALQLRGRQLVAHAVLVKALGGGWNADELADDAGTAPPR